MIDPTLRGGRPAPSVRDYARAFTVLESVDSVRDSAEFPGHLLEALGSTLGYRHTTWFCGATYASLFFDPAPLLNGRMTNLLGPYRTGWDSCDVFGAPQALAKLQRLHAVTATEISDMPTGSREYLRELARRGLPSATALYLRPGGRHALVGVFGPDGTVDEADLAVLRLLGRQLSAIVRYMPGHAPQAPALSDLPPRQRDVAMLVCEGLTNAMVARSLSLSEDTVKKYVSRVLAATGCRSRTELALRLRSRW